MHYESKLIPIMREGVDVIKMILFRKMKGSFSAKYSNRDAQYVNKLAGAVINELFGTPNTEEPFATFQEKNQSAIKQEVRNMPAEFPEMRIPLTDALRVQFLCDHQEGIDSSFILTQADELGILIIDREVPLPAHFMNLVRKLGSSFDLLVQPRELSS